MSEPKYRQLSHRHPDACFIFLIRNNVALSRNESAPKGTGVENRG